VETQNCGWYVPPGDAHALAASLRQRLKNDPREQAALALMRTNAAAVARAQFDRLQLVPQLERIFEEVIRSKS
jgi:glycosyltransferase involved in cell wall biosynthesis